MNNKTHGRAVLRPMQQHPQHGQGLPVAQVAEGGLCCQAY